MLNLSRYRQLSATLCFTILYFLSICSFCQTNVTVVVIDPDHQEKSRHTFASNQTYDDVIDIVMGDQVQFQVECLTSDCDKPEIFGIPDIWISGFTSSRSFVCSPNLTPGEFNPFIPFEDQVHMYLVNKYPEDFQVQVNDWEDSYSSGGKRIWSWNWTAERRTDPEKDAYLADVYFPPTKNFNYLTKQDIQRDDQSSGYAAQLVHYWNQSNNNNVYVPGGAESPKFLLDVDYDEILYVGSKKLNTLDQNWDGLGLAGPRPFFDDTDPNQVFVNWQHMWPEESKIVTYDIHGYPSGGYVLNDYITAYRKFKEHARGNSTYDKYYDGYLIEDYGLWRQDNHRGAAIGGGSIPAKCAEGCKYNPSAIWDELPGTLGNNKHPGLITVELDGKKIQFRIKVRAPFSQDKGFYGAIKGTNWPMGWGNSTTYTLTGLKNMSAEVRSRFSLALVTYKNGGLSTEQDPDISEEIDVYGGTTSITSEVFFNEDSGWNPDNGTWSVDFEIDNGWSVIVAYYNTPHGKAIVAGRDLWVMDPLAQITAPGSNPYPYSNQSLAGPGEVDLKEGAGERVNEYINETRQKEDKSRGFASWGLKKHSKEYVLRKGETITFSATDVGTGKVEIFNKQGPPHLYLWRDLAKYMPPDTIAKYLTYNINELADNGFDTKNNVHTETGSRHLTYTWNNAGIYEVTANFMDMPYNNGSIKVTIVDDYPATSLNNLNYHEKRGNIETRNLRPEELRWLTSFGYEIADLAQYKVAEIKNVLSEYKHAVGPRATEYGDRFGSFRDFANQYACYNVSVSSNSTVPLENPITEWLATFDPQSMWKSEWKNIWLRHTSSNYFPVETINKDAVENNPSSLEFTTLIENVFTELMPTQASFKFVRWLPWIAKSPTDGFKIARYTKSLVDLEKFFNGEDGTGNHGAWSGDPDFALPMLQTALEEETPFSDDDKNLLEFYNDLYHGRAVIFYPPSVEKLEVYNINPLFSNEKNTLPQQIYVDGKSVFEDETILDQLTSNTYKVFDGARHLNGMYYDSFQLSGTNSDRPVSSVAAVGVGLISLCIADDLELDKDAELKVEKTLNTVNGKTEGFRLKKNQSGFPVHFFNINSGHEAEGYPIEYSSIDAAILTCGALFAKKYFSHNKVIAHLADRIFYSIDWSSAIKDPENGLIYSAMDSEGNGLKSAVTSLFNEYWLVVYLASEYERLNGIVNGSASQMRTEYLNPRKFPHADYQGNDILTDIDNTFLSSFVYQFVYYLSHDMSINIDYLKYCRNAMNADKAWWDQHAENKYEWGLGAGSSPNSGGYSADRIDENPDLIVSPHIMAGFIPFNDEIANDLLNLYSLSDQGAVYNIGKDENVLWRYSKKSAEWKSNEIQLIDWSSMLFGIAHLSNKFTPDFFKKYNDYDFSKPAPIVVDWEVYAELPNDKAEVVLKYDYLENAIPDGWKVLFQSESEKEEFRFDQIEKDLVNTDLIYLFIDVDYEESNEINLDIIIFDESELGEERYSLEQQLVISALRSPGNFDVVLNQVDSKLEFSWNIPGNVNQENYTYNIVRSDQLDSPLITGIGGLETNASCAIDYDQNLTYPDGIKYELQLFGKQKKQRAKPVVKTIYPGHRNSSNIDYRSNSYNHGIIVPISLGIAGSIVVAGVYLYKKWKNKNPEIDQVRADVRQEKGNQSEMSKLLGPEFDCDPPQKLD